MPLSTMTGPGAALGSELNTLGSALTGSAGMAAPQPGLIGGASAGPAGPPPAVPQTPVSVPPGFSEALQGSGPRPMPSPGIAAQLGGQLAARPNIGAMGPAAYTGPQVHGLDALPHLDHPRNGRMV